MGSGTDANEENRKALARALKILAVRMRSRKDLADRLRRKGFSDAAVDYSLMKLTELGYLDDGLLAKQLRDEADRVRLLGRRGAHMAMSRAGLPDAEIRGAMESYDESDAARKLMGRKLPRLLGLPKAIAMRRAAGYLQRRGFSAETIRKSLRELEGELKSDEEAVI